MDILDRIAKNLADIGAISFEDYLAGQRLEPQPQPLPSQPSATANEPGDVNAVTQLHQACQRVFRNTDALKFEFIEHSGSRNKQCILTISKPDGVRRSYTTQPIFAKKNEAKLEAAKIAIDMGALEFLTGETKPLAHSSVGPSSTDNAEASDSMSVHSGPSHETFIDDIEKCCLEWRAGYVTPHWVPFSDPKLAYKQGCALRIQLSPHVVRVYLADPTFDTYLDAKEACAKAAILEGVLDFIKHGNGQTHPSSPILSTTPLPPPVTQTTPWTLQSFYESLPRPFPESFETNEASEINAPGWLNTMVQNTRGGKLILSFFFTSDGPPGLHGCLLKLDRPGEYKASLVDARFPKRSDARAAVCLQVISQGIGDYIRSITAAIDAKVTHTMRSFASNLVYPALMSELSKVETDLHPHFEYDKERDAFGATLVVRLSTSPTSEQVQRYAVQRDYRNKADAKVGAICHAAEQGVVEFVRFRGGTPPDGYVSPYTLNTYNPDVSRKRKKPGTEDVEQGRPAKKKRKKGKRRAEGEATHLTSVGQFLSIHSSSDQMHGISRPGDMGLSQSVPADDSCDPSRPGVGGGGGSGAARPVMYGHGPPYNAQMYASSYPAELDPRFAGSGGLDSRSYTNHSLRGAYSGGSHPPRPFEVLLSDGGPSRARPGSSLHPPRRPVEPGELEPGEVVSSAESEFSESSSRNEDVEVPANERDTAASRNESGRESVDMEHLQGSKNKGKGKETSPANTFTTTSRDSSGPSTTTTPHVQKLIDYCVQHHCGTPSFHETQRQGRFQVWIVIGKERFDLPTTYGSAEEGQQRVAKQVLARLSKGSSR